MSKLDPSLAQSVQVLEGKTLFGEIPVLKNIQDKPQRLTDQIGLIKEKAYQDGYEAGLSNGTKIGLAEGRKTGFELALQEAQEQRAEESRKFLGECEALQQEFEENLVNWFAQAEQIITEMSMQIVRRILASELELNQQVSLGICKEVLQHITHAKQARIMINPMDYALFESHREELVKQSRELKGVEIVEDPSVKSGVLVETEAGIIDATVETRLELIENEFTQAA